MDRFSKIIVTGANGWLGKRLVQALVDGLPEFKVGPFSGGEVRCMDLSHQLNATSLDAKVKSFCGDITTKDDCMKVLENAEGALIIHAAGLIHPKILTRDLYRVNVGGTKNILEAAKQVGASRVIVMSSNSPIGYSKNPRSVFDEETPFNSYMNYGRSKEMMEKYLNDHILSRDEPELVIIRAPWFYGPGQPSRQTEFFRMLKKGHFPILGQGQNKRSMVFIDNLVAGIIAASTSDIANGKTYWIADDTPYAMHEIIQVIRELLSEEFGYTISDRNLYLPSVVGDLARFCDKAIQSVGLYNQKIHVLSEMNQTISCTVQKAKSELGYIPKIALKEGMRRSISWCLDNGEAI